MTKEFLSKRGIPFVDLDVANNPAAAAELATLGYRRAGVVVVGGAAGVGWNPARLAAVLGIPFQEEETAAPAELIRSLKLLLDATIRAVRQFPDDRLTMCTPYTRETVRNRAHHTLRVFEIGVDADILG